MNEDQANKMSEDPIKIIAKLEDNQDYSLAPFIEYFIDRGFHIEAYQLKKEQLPSSLQSKIKVDENYFNVSDGYSIFEESFYYNGQFYDFNQYTYENVYSPNIDETELYVEATGGAVDPFSQIKILSYNDRGVSNEFYICLMDSFLFGRILVVTILFPSATRHLLEGLGYKDSESSNITVLMYPIIFKHYTPCKLFYYYELDNDDDIFMFLRENDIDVFKENYSIKSIKNEYFYLDYYNKKWSYLDYKNIGIVKKGYRLSDHEVLLYEKYADNFNCPKELLEQAWQWYRENSYTFMDD